MASGSTASVRDKEEPRGMVAVNGERRSIAKLIRFTPSELERVVDQAQASGRPVACFIREASLGSRPRMKNGTVGDTVIQDRKSTRLNSSHSQISYAVFCLKKKKNKNINYSHYTTMHNALELSITTLI